MRSFLVLQSRTLRSRHSRNFSIEGTQARQGSEPRPTNLGIKTIRHRELLYVIRAFFGPTQRRLLPSGLPLTLERCRKHSQHFMEPSLLFSVSCLVQDPFWSFSRHAASTKEGGQDGTLQLAYQQLLRAQVQTHIGCCTQTLTHLHAYMDMDNLHCSLPFPLLIL